MSSSGDQINQNGVVTMNMYMYYAIFSLILVFGLVTTFMIGFSRKNREGDTSYFQKTGVKWARLTSFYVVAIIAGLLALIAYIRYLIQ
ncbi:hypothetical protein [Paenibacillus planticolens]|nr:hypothetical protein [Paenibacillus planticolens]